MRPACRRPDTAALPEHAAPSPPHPARPLSPASPRPARPADLAALLALESASFAGDRLSRRALRHHLHTPRNRLLVIDRHGQPAAYALLLMPRRWRHARLYSLAVDARARGQGLGRALLAALEAEARAAGYLGVQLEVRADNAAARALYAGAGYRPLTSLPAYYADGAEGWRLRKEFTPEP
ncbi:GNAT family N-acetyltransferase [Roseospirillum parvum]|uniref:Ribosomal protein S18 acetylase RimI n=1 Tax=Roseospirillum parvum TaxID=83401 RepID=A0A1G7URG5_9PROT|nr:GNAT family N-acetyltransferase [Roseospirillum parvum]SDG50123.1 Ribosomal protein S18 acetylase RimI [Roseospirillum parvum]